MDDPDKLAPHEKKAELKYLLLKISTEAKIILQTFTRQGFVNEKSVEGEEEKSEMPFSVDVSEIPLEKTWLMF